VAAFLSTLSNPYSIYVILTLNVAKINIINSVTLVHILICCESYFPTHCYNENDSHLTLILTVSHIKSRVLYWIKTDFPLTYPMKGVETP